MAQIEARTSSTRRKFNAIGVPVVGNGQRKQVLGAGHNSLQQQSAIRFEPKKWKESLKYRYIVIYFKSYFWHINIWLELYFYF
jgi:hypothetical protein